MKKILRKFISTFFYFKLKNKATLNGAVYFNRLSKIRLINRSLKEDIILGNNVRMYSLLISQNNGKIIIGDNVQIGSGGMIGASNSISIGNGSHFACNVEIIDNNNHSINPEDRLLMQSSSWDSVLRKWEYSVSSPIEIGKNVWIGSNARICKGVKIGDNAVIAANSIVTHDVPCNSIAAGNPAKIVKQDIHLSPRLIKIQ